MIVTVTPNPSLDRTLYLDRFVHGGVNRILRTLREPSGKGVNVSLALHTAGVRTLAVLPTGGPAGRELVELLQNTGVATHLVPISGSVRSNLSLVEADGNTTKINEPGPQLDPDEVSALTDRVLQLCPPNAWIAFCGSLPAGFGSDSLRSAISSARVAGHQVVVDTSEAPLQDLLTSVSGDLPDVVKPNTHELAVATGRSIRTVGEVVDAAQVLLDRGVGTVLISMGGDGAVLLDRDGALHGRAPVPRVINTVGAGDSFLAGYLFGRQSDLDRAGSLRSALKWGAIAVQHAGTVFPGPGTVDLPVDVGVVTDPGQLLREPAV